MTRTRLQTNDLLGVLSLVVSENLVVVIQLFKVVRFFQASPRNF